MTGRVVVAGLGPGDPRLISQAAAAAIASIPHRYLRTTRHPSAYLAEPATSFDPVYERASTLDEVYQTITTRLREEAEAHGEILYAVPGSPLIAERTVDLMRAQAGPPLGHGPGLEVEIIPSLSFVDLVWARLGIDPVDRGVRLIDGHRFRIDAAGHAGPFLVAQCDSRQVLSDIKLAVEPPPGPAPVTILQSLGLDGEVVVETRWEDLDRSVEPDHLTCVWIPALAQPVASELTQFAELVRVLRAECPWDRKQTHQSLTRHLIEETYEVLEAIDELASPEGYAHLEEELGDLLFQVAFHSTLAAEAGQFTFTDVARGIHDKLVERHPHVFGPPGHPVPNWEELKKTEKGRESVMDGVPRNLPSLLYAYKVQSKAASVSFDWKNVAGAWPKILEELDELRRAVNAGAGGGLAVNEELGDVLFSVVNVARHLGVDPESALRDATAKFRGRFKAMEVLAQARGVPLDDSLWEEVKAMPRIAPPQRLPFQHESQE
jgi:tetrapyrrole methylase family protein/MazG family protein